MKLTEQHIIKKNHKYYKEIDGIAFLSKNLYNRANYIIRQEFINTSKEKKRGLREYAIWIRYHELQKQLQNDNDVDYTALPRKVSQQVLMLLDKNWKSFFESVKDYKKHPNKYKGHPSLPRYKDKINGRNILIYTIQSISKTLLKRNIVKPSGTSINIPTAKTNIQQVRIVPNYCNYTLEIVYNKECKDLKLDKSRIAGIDVGVNNLIAMPNNNGTPFLLINGLPLKSMNAYYNKKKAKLMSYIGDRGTSNRIKKLTLKRNCKINNYIHNTSRYITNFLVSNNIGTLVIGKNPEWKQSVNIGKKNNQNFVNIPFAKLINQLKYKCKLIGIDVIIKEESHTSKCSFIDNEEVKHHSKYAGRRIKRGLFKSKQGILINSDINGGLNITKKAFPNAFADGIQGVVVRPVRINPYKLAA